MPANCYLERGMRGILEGGCVSWCDLRGEIRVEIEFEGKIVVG